jgi:hypothetical protein
MTDDIKRMDIKEFRELGFIQEINRRLLHPCGLALEVIVDLDTGATSLGGVWDYRDDPEGMAFGEDVLDVEKAKSVEELYHSKDEVRNENFGWVTQPIEED